MAVVNEQCQHNRRILLKMERRDALVSTDMGDFRKSHTFLHLFRLVFEAGLEGAEDCGACVAAAAVARAVRADVDPSPRPIRVRRDPRVTVGAG